MKTSTLLAIASMAIAAPLQIASAQSGPAPAPKFKAEKCYGISKAGHNDCQTMSSSCAGSAKRDRQPDAWVYLPEGVCGKVAGGNIKAKQG